MCDCLSKCCVSIVYIYIYIYHVNKFEARLLFLYLPLKTPFWKGMITITNNAKRQVGN